jgi:hypothetical protein
MYEWLETRCSFNQVQLEHNSQQFNIEAFDNAYNDLLIEEEEYKILRDSVNSFEHSNDISFAKRLALLIRVPTTSRTSVRGKSLIDSKEGRQAASCASFSDLTISSHT